MRMLTKTAAILALGFTPVLTIAPVFAQQIAPLQFQHDGDTYIYTKAVKGERTVIKGKRLSDNARFSLVVQDGRVRGTSNGQPVSFKLSEVKAAFYANSKGETVALAGE